MTSNSLPSRHPISRFLPGVLVAFMILASACTPDIDEKAAFYLAQAQEAFENEVYNAALAFTDSAEVESPALPDTYFLRGRIFTEMARFDLAEISYKTTLEYDPDFRGAWLNLGNLALRKGELKPALEMYHREADHHPSAGLFLQMGRAYADLGVADSARLAYEQALELDSTRATLYMRLGQLHGEQGDLDPAISYTRKGMGLEPENLNYRYALGALLNADGKSQEAVEYLAPFVHANPWHYWGHYNLGQAYQRLNLADSATLYLSRAESLQVVQTEIEHWQSMAESNPQHLMLWIRFSHALRKAGNETDALRADQISYALAPDYLVHKFEDPAIKSVHDRAILQVTSGSLDQAVESYRSLLRTYSRNADLWLNLGVVYATHGRIVQARQSWSVALRYNEELLRARRYIQDLDNAFYDKEAPGNGG